MIWQKHGKMTWVVSPRRFHRFRRFRRFRQSSSISWRISSYTDARLLSASEPVEWVGEEEEDEEDVVEELQVGFGGSSDLTEVTLSSLLSSSSSSLSLLLSTSFLELLSSPSLLLLRSSMTSISPTKVDPSLKSTRFLWARRQFWKKMLLLLRRVIISSTLYNFLIWKGWTKYCCCKNKFKLAHCKEMLLMLRKSRWYVCTFFES